MITSGDTGDRNQSHGEVIATEMDGKIIYIIFRYLFIFRTTLFLIPSVTKNESHSIAFSIHREIITVSGC